MAESLTIRQSQNDSGAILAARKTICFVLARAHRSDGKRFVVRADEKLTAFAAPKRIGLKSHIRLSGVVVKAPSRKQPFAVAPIASQQQQLAVTL